MDSTTHWHSQLAAYGATIDQKGMVADFGDRLAELAALQDATVLVPLTDSGVIRVSGNDAQTFLNTQLTSDVIQVTTTAAQYSGYCTPKGRLLATFLVAMRGGDYLLILPREISESVATRLQRYVLRAKAKVVDKSGDYALLGIAGALSASAVERALGQPPAQPMAVADCGAATVVTLPGRRHLVLCDRDQVDEQWHALRKQAFPAGIPVWELQGIRAGTATVTAATQESFIPQMLGLDKLGAISFNKGCYPGQEIVARTKYLGKLKRQLYYGRSEASLVAGDAILNSGDRKSAGTVANAAPNSANQWEFLAVMQRDAIETGIALASAGGQAVRIERPVAGFVAANDH
jgi:folate-binding protein YgfZ